MTSLAKRLILTFTSVPALFILIFFFPQMNHLAFAVLVFLSVLTGTFEMRNISLRKDEKPLLPFWATGLLPLSEYIHLTFLPMIPLTEFSLFSLFLIAYSSEILRGAADNFEKTLHRISHISFLIIYPGFFSIFLIKLLVYPQSKYLVVMLFLLVFGNDIFAYVFGMLFGKNNRGVFKVSPNKSIAGFIGGSLMTIILSVVWVSIIPSMQELFTLWQAALIGFIIALSSDTGDLIESAFKRGAKVKDAGRIILGRGGLMDSIDSLVASAPIFLLFVATIIG